MFSENRLKQVQMRIYNVIHKNDFIYHITCVYASNTCSLHTSQITDGSEYRQDRSLQPSYSSPNFSIFVLCFGRLLFQRYPFVFFLDGIKTDS